MLFYLLCGGDQQSFAVKYTCVLTGFPAHSSLQLYIALFIHSYQLFICFLLNIGADYTEAKKIQVSFQSR